MKTSMEILTILSRLTQADRGWIIGNLPVQTRWKLLALSAPKKEQPAAGAPPSAELRPCGPAAATDPLASLSSADALTLTSILRSEPAWVIAAIGYARDWSWRTTFLQALPATVRVDVERTQKTSLRLSAHAQSILASLLTRRLAETVAARAPSRFETLVARLSASRSEKRMSLPL